VPDCVPPLAFKEELVVIVVLDCAPSLPLPLTALVLARTGPGEGITEVTPGEMVTGLPPLDTLVVRESALEEVVASWSSPCGVDVNWSSPCGVDVNWSSPCGVDVNATVACATVDGAEVEVGVISAAGKSQEIAASPFKCMSTTGCPSTLVK